MCRISGWGSTGQASHKAGGPQAPFLAPGEIPALLPVLTETAWLVLTTSPALRVNTWSITWSGWEWEGEREDGGISVREKVSDSVSGGEGGGRRRDTQ